jgi:hypothetical protein
MPFIYLFVCFALTFHSFQTLAVNGTAQARSLLLSLSFSAEVLSAVFTDIVSALTSASRQKRRKDAGGFAVSHEKQLNLVLVSFSLQLCANLKTIFIWLFTFVCELPRSWPLSLPVPGSDLVFQTFIF